MRRNLAVAAVRVVVPATIALLVVAGIAPGRLELALRIYALVVAAVVIVLALLALRRAFPSESPLPDTGRARGRRGQQPTSLARAHNEVVLGIASSFDLHYRLVPRLRATATGLLAARRNVSLEGSPDTARALLGDETWELVRPDRRAPQDRLTAGIERERLARVVDSLEEI